MCEKKRMFIKKFDLSQHQSKPIVALFADNDNRQNIVTKLANVVVWHNPYSAKLSDLFMVQYLIVASGDYRLVESAYNQFVSILFNVTLQQFDQIVRQMKFAVLDLTNRETRDIQDVLFWIDM